MMYFYYRFSLFYDDDKSCKKFLKGFFIDYIMFFFWIIKRVFGFGFIVVSNLLFVLLSKYC